jgi:hypothetical protein
VVSTTRTMLHETTISRPTVAVGTWLYSETTPQPVCIIAMAFDYWHFLAEADGQLELDEEPTPLGPEGFLYYASFLGGVDSSGFPTVEEAKLAAQCRVPTPIVWSGP